MCEEGLVCSCLPTGSGRSLYGNGQCSKKQLTASSERAGQQIATRWSALVLTVDRLFFVIGIGGTFHRLSVPVDVVQQVTV